MRYTLLALLLLLGCAGQPNAPSTLDSGRLTLHATLTIPPESATLRLQYGKPVARNAVQEFDPFCVFEITTVSDSPQRVHPDTFQVTRIGYSIDTIAEAGTALPYPAPIRVGWYHDHRPSHIYYKTLIWLHSERQPRARLLTCMSNQNQFGKALFMRHLTLSEIQAALGPDFQLTLR